jgi:Ala-tRNA(Pro) deacylase
MSIPRHIKEYLDSSQVPYRHSIHTPAFTAQEIAHVQHVSGKELAKTVMVLADREMVMAVLPASHRLDLDALKKQLGAKKVRLAQEEEFEKVFPGCELGAMPPLGNLYHVSVWVDQSLHANPSLVFNAGSHTDTIEMSYADFERLVRPRHGRFALLIH